MSPKSFLMFIVLLAFTTSTHAQVKFRNFRNTTGLNVIGDAAVVGNKIRLLPARRDTRGNVWTQQAHPVLGGFRISFAFQYTHQGGSTDGNGNPGNDGLLFYIQPFSNALRQDMEIPPKSLLVFFDGYKNNTTNDISSSRVEVQLNAKLLGQTDVEPLGIRYREGKVIQVRLECDGTCLVVFLNDKPAATYSNIDLNALSPGFVGFHGMGGDAYADVDILNFHFEPVPPRSPVSRHSTVGRLDSRRDESAQTEWPWLE